MGLASLEVFGRTSMAELRGRSMLLTGYLELLLRQGPLRVSPGELSIITPSDPRARGCQLSLKFQTSSCCTATFEGLECRGIVVDHRKPNVIRVAPAPLYNTFSDVLNFTQTLAAVLQDSAEEVPSAKRAKV